MDRAESCFLTSLGCALKGIPMTDVAGLSAEEWQKVFRLASMHHVLPLVVEAVCRLPELRDNALLQSSRQLVRQQVFLQTQKSAGFLTLLQQLDLAGVHPLVVKGIICRNLYPKPDHRFSSDEDLLVRPEDLDRCRAVFAQTGLATTFSPEQQLDSYEIPYRQKDGPLYIELHRYLFPPESEAYGHLNTFFENAHNRAVCVEVSGIDVCTLEYTDHLFYLICHALKHFLHSGFGIRQVCDILMFTQTYGARIDWPVFLENCRKIHAFGFTASLFRIGQRHLGFRCDICPPELSAMYIDEMPMLEDLLQAGVYGSSSESRQHSSNITLDAMASRLQKREARNPLLLSLFPPAQKLQHRYSYLKDRPWLLPAAWVSRVGTYCRGALRKPSSAADALKLGDERIALLSYYGILDP